MSDYAILIMVELLHDRQLHSAHYIAEQVGVENPTVSKLLKQLTRHGLLESVRGANGGYRVVESAEDISVADVIAAIEGPIAMTECSVEAGLCSHEGSCELQGPWQRISEAVAAALANLSLADMSSPASNTDKDAPNPLSLSTIGI